MYLTQGLHRAVQRHPDAIALTHLVDDPAPGQASRRQHTYARLQTLVAQHAAMMRQIGVNPGDRVAIIAPNSDRLIVAILACWWLGAVACPLNTRWAGLEVQHALVDCSPALVLHDGLRDGVVQGWVDALRATVEVASLTEVAGWLNSEALPPIPDTRTGGDALAALLYTGGTTGRSKGVMLSHANLWAAAMCRGAELNNPADWVSLLVAPLFHVAGLGRMIGQLIVGAPWVTMAQFRPDAVLAAIETLQINDMIVVPSMLQALLDAPQFDPARVQCLKRLAFGAAPMPPDLLDRALAAWPDAEFFQAYGLTETAAAVCINLPANHRPQARAKGLLASVGRAGLGTELVIVDPADASNRELPRGQVGEIRVRGPMVMQGYWRQPDATSAAFADGWFKTGDAGRMTDDGYLFIVDRLKDMIITGGENVYCAEVETVLRRHPQVAQAAVIGVPDSRWGEAVCAVIVPREGVMEAYHAGVELPQAPALQAELKALCAEHLAGFKAPKAYRFVAELPMSAAGKVLKHQLRQAVGASDSQA